jgi:beta-lactamase class A
VRLPRIVGALGLAGVVALAGSTNGTSATAGDPALRNALDRYLATALAAGHAAAHGHGSAEQIQAQYDTARDLEEALAKATPVSDGCQPLLAAAIELAAGEVDEAEGVDRPSSALLAAGTQLLSQATAELARLPRSCSKGPSRSNPRLREPISPLSGEAFFDWVQARAPTGARKVEISVDGTPTRTLPLTSRSVGLRTGAQPGLHDLTVRFLKGARIIETLEARNVWVLPPSAKEAAFATTRDATLDARAAALAAGFPATSAIWVQSLRTGRFGGWNTDAVFPAASTVKLAVLVAALKRYGPRPDRSPVAYDLQTLAGWSSNLAANRLTRLIGGSAVAQATLARLGATSSTYPGDYRVGTVVHTAKGDAPDPPPRVSGRVTTAHDLARMLAVIQSAAAGSRAGLAASGLTIHEARLGLALLLQSQPRGDNLGLFRPWVPPSFPMAQKQGWLHDARHTAAILYAPSGPTIAVLLTYRPGIARRDAATLGHLVVQLALGVK